MRFLTSKHHLDAAIPLRSALTALQITLQLRRPPLYSVTPLLSPSTISTLSISNLPSSLLSPSLLVVIIYCLGYWLLSTLSKFRNTEFRLLNFLWSHVTYIISPPTISITFPLVSHYCWPFFPFIPSDLNISEFFKLPKFEAQPQFRLLFATTAHYDV